MPTSTKDFNRLLAETLPHMVWTASPDGVVDYCNEHWSRYVGASDPSEWPKFVHPEDLERVVLAWKHSVTTGESYSCEFRIKAAADGVYRWHLTRALASREEGGTIVRWVGSATDIHELRVARQVAQESEQKLRLMADVIPALVSYMSKDLRYQFVNKAYTDWFEVEREEIEGKSREELLPGGTYSEIKPHEKGALEGQHMSLELTLQKPGKFKILEAHYIPDVDPETNEVRGIVGVGHDITERVESNKRYKTLTEALPQLIWSATAEGLVDYANERCLEYSGTDSYEKFGEGWVSFIHPDDLNGVMSSWAESLKFGMAFKHEYRLRRHDGVYHWFLGRAVPVRDDEGLILYWIGTATDIEDQKQSAREIELAKEAAETANATKSAFLANMSHEIRTPLGVILGFTAMLKDSKLSPADRDHYIDTINRNGQALTRIIDDILDLAKVEAGRLEVEEISFSLLDLVSDVADLFREKARQKGIHLLFDMDDNVPRLISSDPTRLRQILINIVGNAVKFTEKGGVRIRVKAEQDDDRIFKIHIVIKDSGPGLTNDQAARLFKPFSQADNTTTRRFGGTGLGLALSKRLSEALGGTIHIDQYELGQGCTFTVTFLATASENVKLKAPASQPKSCYPEEGSLNGIRVLVVDDSPDNQFLINRVLVKNGATVDLAKDGVEAVEKALENSYDVVLMDIQMPRMDGYQAAAKLFGQGYLRPIVALTAHAMVEERDKTKKAGFAGHLTKPIDNKELIEAVAYHSKKSSRRSQSDTSLSL